MITNEEIREAIITLEKNQVKTKLGVLVYSKGKKGWIDTTWIQAISARVKWFFEDLFTKDEKENPSST